LNDAHKQNVLGRKFLKSLRQNVELQVTDNHIRGVLLDTEHEGETLSKGIDLKYIYYELAQNKNSEAVYNYLKEVYDFYEELSRINKPLLVMLQGHLKNASSASFTLTNMPISTDSTVIRFNETELGNVPCSGASFYLSRIPSEIGTYLALTGESIEGEEVYDAGFSARHIPDHRRDIHDSFIKAIREYEPDKPSFYQYNEQFRDAWLKRTQQKLASEEWTLQEYKDKILNAQNPDELKLVITELILKNKNIEHANYYNNLLNEFEYFKFMGQQYTNHLVTFKKEVLSVLPGLDREASLNRLSLPGKDIDRCFKYETIEEIFAALEKEGTEWAHKTLRTLKRKSPLSLKLTLKLLRNGRNLSLKECFEQEFRVSFRRMHDKDYLNSINARLIERKKDFDQWEHKTFDSISAEQVAHYFEPISNEFKVPEFNSGLKTNSLHPARYFCNEYPEIIRSWVNQESLKDEVTRIDYMKEVRDYLRQLGIDYRNATLNPSNIRNLFFNLDRMKRKVAASADRIKEISEDRVAIEKYQKERLEIIDKFFQDEQKTQAYIDDSVERIFVKLFKERQEEAFNFSRNAHHYLRRGTFHRIKEIITNSRLRKSHEKIKQQIKKDAHELSQNMGISLFFPQDNTKSFLDVPNPDITPHHTYTKYAGQMQIKNPLSPEYYEEYLSGKIPSLAATELEYPESLSKEKVLDPIQAGRFLNRPVKEDPIELQKNIDHVSIWGKPEEIIEYENNRFKTIQSQLLEIDEEFSRLAESNPKIKEKVLNYNPLTDQVTSQIEASADLVFANRKAQLELAEETHNKNQIFKTVNSLDSLLQTQNFVDLEFKKNAQLQSLAFNPKNDSNEDYWDQLLRSTIDTQVLDCIHRLFGASALESQVPEVKNLSNKLKTALTQIYKNKVDQILKEERAKYKNIRPLFTKDNTQILNENNFDSKDQQYMAEIDDYIIKNVNFEFNNFISSHVFYTFAYLGLSELESIHNKLRQIKLLISRASEPEGSEDNEVLVRKVNEMLKTKGITLSGGAELSEFLKYCGTATKSLARLFNLFHEKVHFQEDRILQAYHILKTQFEEALVGRRHTGFIAGALEKEEEQMDKESNSKKIMDLPFLDQEGQKSMLRKGLQALNLKKNRRLADEEKATLMYLLAYSRSVQPGQGGSQMAPGSFGALEMLDIISKRAVYGIDNPIPQHLIEATKDSELPDCLAEFDLREPAQKWIERKTHDALEKLFKARAEYEKNLSKEDLIALDHSLSTLLTPKSVKEAVVQELNKELEGLNLAYEVRNLSETKREAEVVTFLRDRFSEDVPANQRIKNPSALERYHAYAISLKSRIDDGLAKNLSEREIQFEKDYLKKLRKEALLDPEDVAYIRSQERQKGKGLGSKAHEKDKYNTTIQDYQSALENSLKDELKISLRSIVKEAEAKNRALPLKEELKDILRRAELVRLSTSH